MAHSTASRQVAGGLVAVWSIIAALSMMGSTVAAGQSQIASTARKGSLVEFIVTQNSDCSSPSSDDQITILFSNAEVSVKIPPSVFDEDILEEFSFSARDAKGPLRFRRRVADRSFLNARFLRVVNAGGDGWCSGTLSMSVDGRPIFVKVPMYPRKGNPTNPVQNWNRDQWTNKTYWEAPLATLRATRR